MTPLLAATLLLAPPADDPAVIIKPGDGSALTDPAAPLPPPRVLPDGVRTWADLPYRVVDGVPLRLDLALPPAGGEPAPLLGLIHGGGWVAGWKGRYTPETVRAAGRGYAAATVQYRLSGAAPGGVYIAPFPAALEDVRAAVAWLAGRADELNLDPARVALAGDSAGGHLALLAATTANDGADDAMIDGPARVPAAAVVNLFGVTDMPAYYAGSRHARAVLSLFLGGHFADRKAAYEAASPVLFIDADDPPVLTLHGTADTVVPFDQAERLHAALDAAGVANELVPIAGGRHGLWRQREEVARRLYDFLDARLKPALPNENPAAAEADAG